MDNEDELNLDVEESSTLTRVLPVVVLSILALLVGMSVYMFLELRSARAETAEAMQRLEQHEEQIAQLEGTVNRASRSVDEGMKELQGAMAGAEKGIAKSRERSRTARFGPHQYSRQAIGRGEEAAQRQTQRSRRRTGQAE